MLVVVEKGRWRWREGGGFPVLGWKKDSFDHSRRVPFKGKEWRIIERRFKWNAIANEMKWFIPIKEFRVTIVQRLPLGPRQVVVLRERDRRFSFYCRFRPASKPKPWLENKRKQEICSWPMANLNCSRARRLFAGALDLRRGVKPKRAPRPYQCYNSNILSVS